MNWLKSPKLMLRLDVDADVRSLYERVLQLAPGHPGALRGLVQCLLDAEWELRMACASTLFDNSDAHRCWASRAAVMTLEKHAGERGVNAMAYHFAPVATEESAAIWTP